MVIVYVYPFSRWGCQLTTMEIEERTICGFLLHTMAAADPRQPHHRLRGRGGQHPGLSARDRRRHSGLPVRGTDPPGRADPLEKSGPAGPRGGPSFGIIH